MTLLVGSQLDLQKIPLLGIVVQQSAGAPASPTNGQVWYDTGTNRLMGRENGANVALSNTGVVSSGDAAGGDLTGTYPNPTIAALAVTAAKIANNTITDTQVAAANKDGVAGTASMRTLGTGAQQALAGNTRLDQISAPTAAVALNGQKITGLATPTNATDAATKGYVDGVASGLDIKASVRAASTANIAAATYNNTGGASGRGQLTTMPNTIDGVTLAVNDRVLLKNQTTGAQNGIWVVSTLGSGANGVWDRAADFDSDAEVTAGAFVFVEEGTTNADTGWVVQTNNPITIGGASGTSLAFAQFNGAGSISAGAGLTQTGSVFDVVGTAGRISVAADSIDIDANYVGQTSITTLGTITTGTWSGTTIALNKGGTGATTAAAARTNLGAPGIFNGTTPALTAGVEGTVTHNLNSTNVIASFRDATTDAPWLVAYKPTGANTIGVTADVAISVGALKVVVVAGP